jgi:hypothetical protein
MSQIIGEIAKSQMKEYGVQSFSFRDGSKAEALNSKKINLLHKIRVEMDYTHSPA